MATSLLVSNHGSSTWDLAWSGTRMCQTFVMPAGYDRIDYVQLYLRRAGSPGGNVTVGIYATSGGLPTGSALATQTYASNSISTSGQTIQFDFTDIAVTAGSKYAIVFDNPGTSSSSNVGWYRGSNSYANGDSYWKYSAGSWTANGYDMWFEVYGYQSALTPTVTTDSIGTVTSSGFTVAGNVSSDGGATVTERGVVYSPSNGTPTTGDSKQTTTGTTGAMSVAVTGLSPGTLYYVRAYAINSQGTSYGAVLTQSTDAVAPTVTTDSVASISSSQATGSGTVTADGGATVSERGIVWGTSSNPTTAGNKIASGSGLSAFNGVMTSLSAVTLYHYRAYAINSVGTSYGTDKTFTSLDIIKKWAQSFIAVVTGTITKISIPVKLFLGTSGTLKLKIYNSSAGAPNTVVYTATPITLTNTSYQTTEIAVNYAITSGSTYWIVIEDPFVPGSFEIGIGYNTAGGYASGAIRYQKSSTTPTWESAGYSSADMMFYVYTQPTVTAPFNVEIRSRKLYK